MYFLAGQDLKVPILGVEVHMLQDFLRIAGKKDTTHSRAVSSRIFYELQEKKTPSLVGQRVAGFFTYSRKKRHHP